MRPDAGAIDVVGLPVDPAFGVGNLLDGCEEPLPDPRLLPAVEAAGYRTPRAVALGKISPGGSGPIDPQDAVHDPAVIRRGTSRLRLLRRQQGSQLGPLLVRHISSSHPPTITASEQVCKHALVLNPELRNSLAAAHTSIIRKTTEEARRNMVCGQYVSPASQFTRATDCLVTENAFDPPLHELGHTRSHPALSTDEIQPTRSG